MGIRLHICPSKTEYVEVLESSDGQRGVVKPEIKTPASDASTASMQAAIEEVVQNHEFHNNLRQFTLRFFGGV